MKKLPLFFAAIMTVATLWFLCSCGTDGMKNVSERRSAYYTASDGSFTVTAVSGVRETPYAADGEVATIKPYTLITVVPSVFDVDAVYTYKAKTQAGEYGGALVVHPFAASFSAEFDAETTGDGFTVTVKCGDSTYEYVMSSLVTDEMMTYDSAIDAAVSEIKPQGQYEIRARIIKNPLDTEPILCWHVLFYLQSGGESSVLLDPVTAKILAKKQP